MFNTDDLTKVRTCLDSATAAQSYHQAQIAQLSYDLAQLREQLKNLTEKQSTDNAAHNRGSVLNPTADAYCPQSPTSSPRATTPTPKDKRQTPAPIPVTGATHASPAPGTPATSVTPPPPPALPRARATIGGFAAAYKTAVTKSKACSTPTAARPPAGSPDRPGTSPPPSAPTTELNPSSSGYSAGDAVKRMLDLAQVGGYSDSEGDY